MLTVNRLGCRPTSGAGSPRTDHRKHDEGTVRRVRRNVKRCEMPPLALPRTAACMLDDQHASRFSAHEGPATALPLQARSC